MYRFLTPLLVASTILTFCDSDVITRRSKRNVAESHISRNGAANADNLRLASGSFELKVLENSEYRIAIVLPADPIELEKDAAKELQLHLGKIAGTRPPIFRGELSGENNLTPLRLGRCSKFTFSAEHLAPKLENDGIGFAINATGMYLCGNTGLATRFAVSEFLERYLDIRWFLPENFPRSQFPPDMGTHIPQKQNATIAYTLKEGEEYDIWWSNPGFRYRRLGNAATEGWALRNRTNFYSFEENAAPNDAEEYGFQANSSSHSFHQFVDPETLDRDYFSCLDYQSATGPVCVHDIAGEPGRVTLLGKDVVAEGLLRTLKLKVGSEQVVTHMVNEIIRQLQAEKSHVDLLILMPPDGGWEDESPSSLDMDDPNHPYSVLQLNREKVPQNTLARNSITSHRYTTFYHRVIEQLRPRLEREVPEKANIPIMNAAYGAYKFPPLNRPDIKFGDNVLLMFARQSGHEQPLANAAHRSLSWAYRNALYNWRSRHYQRGNFGIFDYPSKDLMRGLHFPIGRRTIAQDIKFYKQFGVQYYAGQMRTQDVGFIGFNYYVATKLLWDPNLNIDQLFDDFMDKFYGQLRAEGVEKSTSQLMSEHYACMENLYYGAGVSFPPAPGLIPKMLRLEQPNLLADCTLLVQQAFNVAENSAAETEEEKLQRERVKLRIQSVAVGMEYMRLVGEYLKEVAKEIQNVVQNQTWRPTSSIFADFAARSETDLVRQSVNKIRAFLAANVHMRSVPAPDQSPEVNELLNPIITGKSLLEHYWSRSMRLSLDKDAWLNNFNQPVAAFLGMAPTDMVDLWIRGTGLELTTSEAAHFEVQVQSNSGKEKTVGHIATGREGGGNQLILARVRARDIIRSDAANPNRAFVVFKNCGEQRPALNVHAVAIMPHQSPENSDMRIQSHAFVEFGADLIRQAERSRQSCRFIRIPLHWGTP